VDMMIEWQCLVFWQRPNEAKVRLGLFESDIRHNNIDYLTQNTYLPRYRNLSPLYYRQSRPATMSDEHRAQNAVLHRMMPTAV
jgi:hypothetical protein